MRRNSVVIDGDEVIYGIPFVMAAIVLGSAFITVVTIEEYEGRLANPCAEIPLGGYENCNLGAV